MKTKLLLSILLFSFTFCTGVAQVPQGFNYQAVAQTTSGLPIANTTLQVKIGILSDTVAPVIVWEELHSTVKTNANGVFNLAIGTGTRISGTAAFKDISWNAAPLFIRVQIYHQGTWRSMGSAKLWSVPYAMVSDGVASGSKLSIVSQNDSGTDALFEVKRADGQTVFAVYPDAVNVYVPRSGKGQKGGFAVGGFDNAKLPAQDYLRVTPDSVRIYIDPTPVASKGTKGGFAVGGYGESKGIDKMYFNLTGASSVNTVKASPQVLWYPVKNAFLAGNVSIGHVDSVGDYSTALGYQSRAAGNYSQAFGYKAVADGNYSTSIGKRSIAGVYKSMHNAFAFGDAAKALSSNSIAFGNGAQSINTNALAIGNGTIASGTNSTAMGYQSQAQGDKSIAIGSFYSTSINIPRIVLGKGGDSGDEPKGIDDFLIIRPITPITTFLRSFSRANIASGQYSVAIGNGNLAQNGGLVFGSNSDAAKFGALALGTSATANETNSVAIGYDATANGVYSVAIGNNITANSYGEFALGQWNVVTTGTKDSWNQNELLFTVGNGTSTSDRSNALTIYKDGKTNLMGRFASTTFNYKISRRYGFFFPPVYKDYVYGVYSLLNRDDPAIEYYYSGYFASSGTNGTYKGLYADLINTAEIHATTIYGTLADVAEYIYDTNANTEPADVVIADAGNKESIIKSTKPYQTSVVGVISTKPMMTMGNSLVVDETTGEPLTNPKPAARLALTGRVPVKVSGENGAIVPGDYLTTSSTPGHAMKWTLLDVNAAKDFDDLKRILSENEKRRNAIFGKAVESFSGTGTGKIIVLISLQ